MVTTENYRVCYPINLYVILLVSYAVQEAYDKSHANSIEKSRRFLSSKFVSWVVEMVLEKGWSLDACYGYAKTCRLRDSLRQDAVQLCLLYASCTA